MTDVIEIHSEHSVTLSEDMDMLHTTEQDKCEDSVYRPIYINDGNKNICKFQLRICV